MSGLKQFFKGYPFGIGLLGLGVLIWLSFPREFTMNGQIFGTFYQIKAYRYLYIPQDTLQRDIVKRLEQLDQTFSSYRNDSLLGQINHAKAGESIPVNEDFVTVFKRADQWVRLSKGRFDPSKKGVSDLWGISGLNPQFPSSSDIQKTLLASRWDDFKRHNFTITKTRSSAQLDFSAIVEGFGVDQIVELLDQASFHAIYVNIGGEVRVKGPKSHKTPWRIGIQDPQNPGRVLRTLQLAQDIAMATSGTYHQFKEWNGKAYSHIIDPQTGIPIQNDLISVTVLSKTCMDADALATALMVMGSQNAITFAKEQQLALLLIYDQQGKIQYYQSPEMDMFLID